MCFMKIFEVFCFALFYMCATNACEWSYQAPYGPANWTTQGACFPYCSGDQQSPINIDESMVKFSPLLGNFTYLSYELFPDNLTSLELENNGHTALISFGFSNTTSPAYYLEGGNLTSRYFLEQLHFHWGENNSVGSEHQLDMQTFPLELHLIHYKADLQNVSYAKTKWYGVAVFAFLFEVSNGSNSNYSFLVNTLKNIQYEGDKVQLQPFVLQSLLPQQSVDIFRYQGSLTTPTCNEGVIWTVARQKISLSANQLDAFRQLATTTRNTTPPVYLTANYRPTQPRNKRPIYVSRPINKAVVNLFPNSGLLFVLQVAWVFVAADNPSSS